SVSNALAGALGTVTLVFRVVGGIAAGTAADRWGRKGPLMYSILWYSALAFLSGFSTSYRMLFALRALFGIGMGGVWAAGVPLTIEHWPAHLRGTASGLLQGGYSIGIILSAFVYQFWYARFLASIHREPLPFLLALNAGGIAGAALWGRLSETWLGRRGALSLAMAIGITATPLYLFAATGLGLWIGALVVGMFAAGC